MLHIRCERLHHAGVFRQGSLAEAGLTNQNDKSPYATFRQGQPRLDLTPLTCSPDQHRRRIDHAYIVTGRASPKRSIHCERLQRPSEAGVSDGSTDTLDGRRRYPATRPDVHAPKTFPRGADRRHAGREPRVPPREACCRAGTVIFTIAQVDSHHSA